MKNLPDSENRIKWFVDFVTTVTASAQKNDVFSGFRMSASV